MNRQEIYKKIKSDNLAEDIKKYFGKNYTNVSTSLLEDWIKSNEAEKVTFNEGTIKAETIQPLCGLYDGFRQLVTTLVAHRAITPMEAEEVLDIVFK